MSDIKKGLNYKPNLTYEENYFSDLGYESKNISANRDNYHVVNNDLSDLIDHIDKILPGLPDKLYLAICEVYDPVKNLYDNYLRGKIIEAVPKYVDEIITLPDQTSPDETSDEDDKNASIILNESNLKLKINQIKRLNYTITPSNYKYREVEWISTNPDIVKVNNSGEITGISKGTCNIIVRLIHANKEDICTIDVDDDNDSYDNNIKITLSNKNVNLHINEIKKLSYIITPSDCKYREVEWISTNPNIAIVNDGEVIGINKGTCNVIVKLLNTNKEDICTINVDNDDNIKITLSDKDINLRINETKKINYIITPLDCKYQEVEWVSSNINIATVNSGEITGINKGTCNVIAKLLNTNKEAYCTVNVGNNDYDNIKITLSNKNIDLYVNETKKINYTINPPDCKYKEVEWVSTNPNIATIYNGEIRGISEGTCNAIVKLLNTNKEAYCTINVKEKGFNNNVTLTLNYKTLYLYISETKTLICEITPKDYKYQEIQWISTDKEIAIVNNGQVTGLKKGSCYIVAKLLNTSKDVRCKINVRGKSVITETKLSLNKYSLNLSVNETKTLICKITPPDYKYQELLWESTDNKVATVNNGNVTGISKGNCYIVVKLLNTNKSLKCMVNVNDSHDINTDSKNIRISLTKKYLPLKKGKQEVLYYEIYPPNSIYQEVEWESSNSDIATVNEGLVTGIEKGECNVTVKLLNTTKKSSCKVKIYNDNDIIDTKNIKFYLSHSYMAIEKDKQRRLRYTIFPQDCIYQEVEWESSDNDIATIEEGLITGIKDGNCVINARLLNTDKTAKCKIRVYTGGSIIDDPQKVRISMRRTLLVNKGSQRQLNYEIYPCDSIYQEVKWESSDNSIATVEEGLITGIEKGKCNITLKLLNTDKKAECLVTVIPEDNPIVIEDPPKEIKRIELSKSYVDLYIDETCELYARIYPNDVENKEVIWSSTDESIATVEDGLITAVEKGQCKIFVTTVMNNKKDYCYVTVKKENDPADDDKDPIKDDPPDFDLEEEPELWNTEIVPKLTVIKTDPREIVKKEFYKNTYDIVSYYLKSLNDEIGKYYYGTFNILSKLSNKNTEFLFEDISSVPVTNMQSQHLYDTALKQQRISDNKINFLENGFNVNQTVLHIQSFLACSEMRNKYINIQPLDSNSKLDSKSNFILKSQNIDYDIRYIQSYNDFFKYLDSSVQITGDIINDILIGYQAKDLFIRDRNEYK